MINNFYTLQALTREWQPDLRGTTLVDAFSQVKNELSLAFEGETTSWMLRTSVEAPFLFIFRSEGYNKARQNVATLFKPAFEQRVSDIHMAERDRMLFIRLDDGWHFRLPLFGTRANMYLVNPQGTVEEAFRSNEKHKGSEPPSPRPAPMPDDFEAFLDGWKDNRNQPAQAVAASMTLFTRPLADEAVYRAGVTAENPEDCTEDDKRLLYESAVEVRNELENPDPRVYWDRENRFAEEFALIPFQHMEREGEAFASVDDAVSVFVRRRLAEQHFRRLYKPLEKALRQAAEHYRSSAEHMMEELSNPSRADEYERWGHLLMAAQSEVPRGADEVELPDLFAEGEAITIPLDPALSPVENAQHYYDRARRTRKSRESAEERLDDTLSRADAAESLLEELHDIDGLKQLKQFRRDRADDLAPFVESEKDKLDAVPFRRFKLNDTYEVWVGKNAKQNDELTFHHAQKYDLWMHARNMPGSHTVLRLPNRDDNPPKQIIHCAASIAAYYSKGRGSKLVPVMYTQRKYVRSPKGSPTGAVRVDREEVVLVEPRLP